MPPNAPFDGTATLPSGSGSAKRISSVNSSSFSLLGPVLLGKKKLAEWNRGAKREFPRALPKTKKTGKDIQKLQTKGELWTTKTPFREIYCKSKGEKEFIFNDPWQINRVLLFLLHKSMSFAPGKQCHLQQFRCLAARPLSKVGSDEAQGFCINLTNPTARLPIAWDMFHQPVTRPCKSPKLRLK